MRPVILLVGIIIIVAGVVLLEVPFLQSSAKTVTATTPAHFHVTERVQVLASQPVSVSWSSNTSVTLVLRTCSSINLSANTWGQCTGGSNLTETGTSGSVATNVPVGGYLWAVVLPTGGAGTNRSASVSVATGLPTEALGLWGLGGLIVIVGLLLRGRKKPVSAVEPSPAAAPATPDAEQTAVAGPTPAEAEEGPGEEPFG
jgi:hypothetical protein